MTANGNCVSNGRSTLSHTGRYPSNHTDELHFSDFSAMSNPTIRAKSPGHYPKAPEPYTPSKPDRICFPVMLTIFIVILIVLLVVFVLCLRFFITINVEDTSLHNSTNSNIDKDDSSENHSTKGFAVKVSLFDPLAKVEDAGSVDHSKLPLGNLTRLCMDRKGECWFHPKKYPHSCRKTFCESVEFRISYNASSANVANFNPVIDVFEINDLPDRTPCAVGSWCMSGDCVVSNDLRLSHYNALAAVKGGWSNNCERPKCMVNAFARKYWKLLLMSAKCPGMPCSAYTTEIRRLQFRSCTNPLPARDGVGCDINELPALWGPVCQDCPDLLAGNDQRKLYPTDVLYALCGSGGRFLDEHRCACIRSNGRVERVDEGAPCKAKLNDTHTESGQCFFGKCLTFHGLNPSCASH